MLTIDWIAFASATTNSSNFRNTVCWQQSKTCCSLLIHGPMYPDTSLMPKAIWLYVRASCQKACFFSSSSTHHVHDYLDQNGGTFTSRLLATSPVMVSLFFTCKDARCFTQELVANGENQQLATLSHKVRKVWYSAGYKWHPQPVRPRLWEKK